MRLLVFLFLSLSYVRHLSFYFWYHAMLLTLKEDNTTDSFYPCLLLHVHSVIVKFGVYMYKCVFIHNYYMYRWHGGIYVYMYTIGCYIYDRLQAIHLLTVVYIWINLLWNNLLVFMSHTITKPILSYGPTVIWSSTILNYWLVRKQELPAGRQFVRYNWLLRYKLKTKDGDIYYIWKSDPADKLHLVVPKDLKNKELSYCHDHKFCGHLWHDKTIAKLKQSVYWYNLELGSSLQPVLSVIEIKRSFHTFQNPIGWVSCRCSIRPNSYWHISVM